ncbi:hypothetical protein [Prevotella sp.]|uniref:hypothetical protein n=1 Tax=Prevotella sp. TaxID=59823 RepID=UPI003AB86515
MRIIFVLFISITVILPMHAQWNKDSSAIVISYEDSYAPVSVKAFKSCNNTFLVWLSMNEDEAITEHMQVISSNGETFSKLRQVGSQALVEQNVVAADVDQDGNLNTIISDSRNDESEQYYDLFLYRYSASGDLISGQDGMQVELNSDNPTNVRLYCEGDSYYLTYTVYDPAQWSDVYCVSRINLDGKLMWKDDVKILGEAAQLWPISDGFILTYIVDNMTYAQRYTSDGSPMWSSNVCLSPGHSVYKNYYDDTFVGSADGKDGIIIAYKSYDQDGSCGILMQHVNKDGSFTNFCPFVINADNVTSFISSAVDGDIYYAYENSEYDNHNVSVVRISPEGNYLWNEPKILDGAESSSTPLSIHKLGDGRLFVVYTKGDSWADGNLCAGVMSAEGNVEWKKVICNSKGNCYNVIYDDDAAYIYWAESNNKTVSAARIYYDGSFSHSGTGIDDIRLTDDTNVIYNTSGMRVGDNWHGIVITNGKKYLKR